MPLKSIRNGRGFFSDYWLGSVLGSRKRSQGARLTPGQAHRLLRRLIQLRQRVDTAEPVDLTTFRERYARPLLGEIFGYSLSEDSGDRHLRLLMKRSEGSEDPSSNPPTATPSTPEPLAAIYLSPDPEELEARPTHTRMDRALMDYDLAYGFILTPEVLRLVRHPDEGHKNAHFDFAIASAVEGEDIDSLAVAWQVFNAANFIPSADGRRPVEILEEESRRHSARVSEDLKEAVFTSAELLIRGFLDEVRQNPEAFHPAPSLHDLRDAALQALYRLLFILYAESRDERLQTHLLYLKSYSLERLVDRLLRVPLGAFPANRYGYWSQLLALFRIYDQGMPALPGLQNIPPRGGTLFSDRTPAGGFLTQVKLPDRLTARLLLTLASTRPRRGVGRERVSFRELAIEQLGAVYEGLLEYEPRMAEETRIEVSVQGKEFVLTPTELCRLCEQKDLVLKGSLEIVEGTEAAALHPDLVEEEEEAEGFGDAGTDDEESAPEEEDEDGVKKGAKAILIRRLEPEDFYFVPGHARKSSGSYYTREEIVQYLVQHALQDLVEGKSFEEIESLRIIDPACGSAHFLVGAARYLGRRLYEAYRRELGDTPPRQFHPDRDLTPKIRDQWTREGEAWCKRRIVERCLFGVDLNPMAVQLAQVALWIESLAGDRPLSFFDHHIRCGNSLLGTWADKIQEAPHPSLGSYAGELFGWDLHKQIAAALGERLLIDQPLPAEVPQDTPKEYEYKEDRLRRAEELLKKARLLFDLRSASPFLPAIWNQWHTLLQAEDPEGFCRSQAWWEEFEQMRQRERFFHWELEFPEVFHNGSRGFDVVLGNPPWDKVKPDRKEFYGKTDILIRAYTGGELDVRIRELHQEHPALEEEFEAYSHQVRTLAACLKRGGDYHYVDWEIDDRSTGGDPDLFKFFVERGHQILRPGGRLGFLVPSALYNNEGCTGLRHLLLDESSILAFYGFENRQKLFPIDSRYKFVCLVLEKTEGAEEDATRDSEFKASFMRHDVAELEHGPPSGVQVLIRRRELEQLSPGTLAFLEFRSEQDREIVLKMYGLLPGMEPRPLLGEQGPGTWNARFYTEFHMTNDRDLWTKPNGQLYTPKEVCALNWPANPFIPFAEVRAAMAREGFWPLYEGKHIEQFLIDIRPIERWVSIDAVLHKYKGAPNNNPKLVYRRIASNTNERSLIASVIPPESCFGDSLFGIDVEGDKVSILLSILNTSRSLNVLKTS